MKLLPPFRLLKLGWQQLMRQSVQTLLMLFSLALGVAVILAIDLASGSAMRAFELSQKTLSGTSSHQIRALQGSVPDQVYFDLKRQYDQQAMAPVIQADLQWQQENIQLLGIDPFAEAPFRNYLNVEQTQNSSEPNLFDRLLNESNQVLVSESWAKSRGIQVGSQQSLHDQGRQIKVTVAGLLKAEDPNSDQALSRIWICDIATAQALLQRSGISHIDLQLSQNKATQAAEVKKMQARLPAGLQIVSTQQDQQNMRSMSHAFELNLRALSYLSLLVGMFLIYNTISFAIVRRRPILAILRALGATRFQLFVSVVLEVLVLSLVAGLIGLGLGILLAQHLLGLVTQTINDHYYALEVQQLYLSQTALLKALLAGLLAALGSSLLPAWDACHTPPIGSMNRSALEQKTIRYLPWLGVAGLLFILAGSGILQWPSRQIEAGFAGLTLIILGYTLWVPPLVWLSLKALRAAPVPWLFKISLRNLERALSRTGLAVASLMLAVSVIIGLGLMVGSFRQSVDSWLQTILQADVYISDSQQNRLPAQVVSDIRSLPMVKQSVTSRVRRLETPAYGFITLNALSQDLASHTRHYRWIDGSAEQVWAHLEAGDIMISDTLAYHHQLKREPGLSIQLPTAQGLKDFRVRAIYDDYSAERGSVMLSQQIYQQLWQDNGITGLALLLQPTSDINQAIEAIEQKWNQENLDIRSNKGLREMALAIFDRTFTVTEALRLLTISVAFLGVLATVMALQLERQRELATLRALGFTPWQMAALIQIETSLMGLLAGLLALPLGYALAQILIRVINLRSFGWQIEFHLQAGIFAQALLTAGVAGLVSGLYPAWKIRQQVIAEGLRSE